MQVDCGPHKRKTTLKRNKSGKNHRFKKVCNREMVARRVMSPTSLFSDKFLLRIFQPIIERFRLIVGFLISNFKQKIL